ncbi:hypothetical protein GCM10027275_10420 [Rhabdobacter roseus]|uniref:RHS repeat-associated protein n=1 Tax=Rhabdobacter roseus TaxID=1655419 RepID=A0A840TSH2_9BACT|nr:RHS repeat-associated core domain-containing protein [Rhabdobacter roseus]MBB5282950.1 RHS repeat-associated protein [Rhabdobacter roseus]
MNDPAQLAAGKDFFGMSLNYDAVGNISGWQYRSAQRTGSYADAFSVTAKELYQYSFTYDNLYRLKTAGLTKAGAPVYALGGTDNGAMDYDANGNIVSLRRSFQGSVVDELSYVYAAGSNRLASVADGGTNPSTPNEFFGSNASYGYDANGNLISDSGKGISNIAYNYLNLPQAVTKGSQTIGYTYDAGGQKLKADFGSGKVYDYIAGLVYVNDSLEFIPTAEGRILPPGRAVNPPLNDEAGVPAGVANTFYRYEYQLRDHLGNLRIACRCGERENAVTPSQAYAPIVVQENHYDPWGLSLPLNAQTEWVAGSPADRFTYNGKEKQGELGWHDYGARMYDAQIGRWGVVDPLAEKREWLSPYNYVQNNPILRVDPDGAFDFVQRGDGSIYWDKNANSQATTKQGETYLGTSLNFTFNSYINNTFDGPQPPWDVTGDKLTSTIIVTGNEAADGSLTSVDIKSSYSIGETGGIAMFKGRDYFPGLGGDQNKAIDIKGMKGGTVTFEQHASVPGIEAAGLSLLGYDVVNVAQKATFNLSGNKLSVTASTDVFPSATLSVNGKQLFQYNQPSFKATHGRGSSYTDNGTGGAVTNDIQRRPTPSFHTRYKK